MDQSSLVAHRFWLGVGLSAAVCITLLWVFENLRLNLSAMADDTTAVISIDPS